MKLHLLPVATLIAIAVAAITYSLWCFPWVTRYWFPSMFVLRLSSSGTYVVVSDVHLWYSVPEIKYIGDLCRKVNATALIVAGDLFEERRRVTTPQELVDLYERALTALNLWNSVNFVVHVLSMSSHDYDLWNSSTVVKVRGVNILIVEGILILEVDRSRVYVLHGDYLCRNGFVAHVINRVFGDLFLERLGRSVLKLGRGDWLIMGHTHIPGIDYGSKVVNCGSWMRKVLRVNPSLTACVLRFELGRVVDVSLYKLVDGRWSKVH